MTLVLHVGARRRGAKVRVTDPAGLLAWLGEDRATVTFADVGDVEAKAPALTALVREWVAGV